MAKKSKALVILGPTCVGKTEVALEVAKRLNGEVINGDKFYLFSGLPISTGLSASFVENIRTHLYGILGVQEDRLSLVDYLFRVNELVPQILKRRKLPIVEGCSYGYTNGLRELNKLLERERYGPFVGLKLPEDYDLKGCVKNRIEKIFDQDVVSEVRKMIEKGYKNSFPLRQGAIAVPIVEYLEGKSGDEKMREKIMVGILEAYYTALRKFLNIPEITWIEHIPGKVQNTVKRIEELVI